MSGVARARQIAATWLLSLWWGGFSFYAGRVVFIGHDVLHSKIRQGFITERVTLELNWLALAALAVVGWELIARHCRRRIPWIAWAIALGTTVVLVLLHARLAAMLDFSELQVADDEHFYGWHRAYLWIATAQWLAGGTLLARFRFDPGPG